MNDGFPRKLRFLSLLVCFLLAVFGVGVSLLLRGEGDAAICLRSFFPISTGYEEWIPGSLYVAQWTESGLTGPVKDILIPPWWIVFAMLIVISGQDRWKLWMRGMSWFCLGVWGLLPIVYCFFPALADSDMLKMCRLILLIYLASAVLYYVVVPVLWPRMLKNAEGSVGIDAVNPTKGKTVKQIAENGINYKPRKFLFGKADEKLVAHWGMVGKAIIALSKTRRRRVAVFAVILLAWPLLVFTLSGGSQGIYERDVELMWETVRLPDGTVVASVPAVEAARRVFADDVALRGLTRDEVRKLLRFDLMNPEYKLNRPRYSWEEGRMFLRISSGRNSAFLQLGTNDEGKVVVSWMESFADTPNFLKEAVNPE